MGKLFTHGSLGLHGLLAFVLFYPCGQLEAAHPRLWRQQAYAEFAAGETKGVAITRDGRLLLAPDLEDFASLEVQRIWSLAAGPDGVLYAGTGEEGKIYAIDPEGRARLVFDSPELHIHALIVGPDNALYAGTAPDGLIYRIDPTTGQAATLAHTGSHYVWDLVFDAQGGLYAATGEPGKLLTVSAAGEVETLYDPSDQHVICLVADGERFYAGTAREARIYEIDAQGDTARARLLYAAPQQEIHDLVVGPDGALYASAIPESVEKEKPENHSAVYRIAPDGAVVSVWQEPESLLIDLVAGSDGRLLAATNQPPRLYHIQPDGEGSLLLDFDPLQPGRLLATPDGALYIGGAQSGSLARLSSGFREEGHFDSAVEDFASHARWGALSWRSDLPDDTGIRVQTRSGNSQEPDATWSPWSDPLAQPGDPVSSPPARYLQYRVTLETDRPERTPVVHEVGVFGQQTNLRPRISQLEVAPYRTRPRSGNGSRAQDPSQPPLPTGASDRRRPPPAKSLHLIRWQATDPNGDELAYRLYLRSVDQQEWKLAEEDISQTSLLWDTATMPEGVTLLKLVASDRPDNPRSQALENERVSPPFAIDNSPPLVALKTTREGSELRVDVEIEDRISPVYKAEYSIDYGDAVHQIGPLDGLFDSRRERARFTVADLPPGEHVIAVRVWDELDNVGTAQVIVPLR